MVALEKKQKRSLPAKVSAKTSDSDEDSSEEERTVVKTTKKVEMKQPAISEDEDEQEAEEEEDVGEFKIHKRPLNDGLGNGSLTKDDLKLHQKLTECATDCNSKENMERGDFKNFNLSKNIIEKLKAKKINFLYPIQIASLEHIRDGHDIIAQASEFQ